MQYLTCMHGQPLPATPVCVTGLAPPAYLLPVRDIGRSAHQGDVLHCCRFPRERCGPDRPRRLSPPHQPRLTLCSRLPRRAAHAPAARGRRCGIHHPSVCRDHPSNATCGRLRYCRPCLRLYGGFTALTRGYLVVCHCAVILLTNELVPFIHLLISGTTQSKLYSKLSEANRYTSLELNRCSERLL